MLLRIFLDALLISFGSCVYMCGFCFVGFRVGGVIVLVLDVSGFGYEGVFALGFCWVVFVFIVVWFL